MNLAFLIGAISIVNSSNLITVEEDECFDIPNKTWENCPEADDAY